MKQIELIPTPLKIKNIRPAKTKTGKKIPLFIFG